MIDPILTRRDKQVAEQVAFLLKHDLEVVIPLKGVPDIHRRVRRPRKPHEKENS